MTPLNTLIQTVTYESTPPGMRLPPVIWSAFSVLNKIHGIWRWFRRIELYRNPDNLTQILAGHAVNFVLGDITLLRIAAQCLLISTRVLECVQEQASVCRSGRRWMEAIKGHYPEPVEDSWEKYPQKTLRTTLTPLWNQVHRISLRTFSLLKHTFLLSMRIMDAVDAFCLSPYTRNEGINEGFVNAIKWLDTIVQNKDELLTGMVENRSIIDRILTHSPFTFNQLYDNITNTLEKTEFVAVKAKKIASFGNGALIYWGKRITGGAMVVMGLADYRPTNLASNSINP